MKTIENKKVKLVLENTAEINATYGEWIDSCIKVPPQGGFSYEDMVWRLKVDVVLKKAKAKIELEDADFEQVKEAVKKMKWNVLHEELKKFTEYIMSVK